MKRINAATDQTASSPRGPMRITEEFGKTALAWILCLILVSASVLVSSPAAAQSCLPSGLVSWWNADVVSGTTAFDVKSGKNAEMAGGVAIVTGKVGNAFSFDGFDDYLLIPDSNLSGLFESGSDFTITLWANKFPNRSSPIMLSLMSANGGTFCVGVCNAGLEYIFYGNGTSPTDYGIGLVDINTCGPIAVARGVTNVPENQWVFLSAVYQNGNLILYENGNEVATDLAGNTGWIKPSPSRGGGLVIGTASHALNCPGSVHHYTGLLDEIQVYDRALSDSEIQAVMSFPGCASTYSICPLYDQTRAVRRGATIPIKLQLCDANGGNLSSPAVVVTATSVTRVSDNAPGPLEDAGNANPDNNFRYDATLGGTGGYIFNLSTKDLSSGTYRLSFSGGSDPTTHSVEFQVK